MQTVWGLASARPALFIGSPHSEIARVIDEEDCGVTIDQGDVDALLDAIERYAESPDLLQSHGDAGREALVRTHAAVHRCADWEELLYMVVGDSKRNEGQ